MSKYSSDTIEDTFHPAHLVAAVCGALNVEQVRDLLKHGVEITERAKKATAFAKMSGALGKAADKLDDATEQLDRGLKRGRDLAADASAACEIAEAMDVLNQWMLPGSGVSSLEAAKAFDQLFSGTARFFAKLPPPFNRYAGLLAEIGRVSFFSNMEEIMRRGQATSGGEPMRRVLDSMDHAN